MIRLGEFLLLLLSLTPSSSFHRVMITEVMPYPVGTAISYGQWIEILNPEEEPFNLQGLVISTLSSRTPHVISFAKEMLLGPGEYVILGRTADQALNGGVVVDYVYGGEVLLDPEKDIIVLSRDNEVLDAFSYGFDDSTFKYPVVAGMSLSLEPSEQVIPVWCFGRKAYGDFGNKGTPGAPNTWCDNDNDGYAEDEGDCDDTLASVHPNAQEVCNGIDDDCNGLIDEGLSPPQMCLSKGVCAGTSAICKGKQGFVCEYPLTYEPIEVSCDGLDNDCDGETDEDLPLPKNDCLQDGVCAGSKWICTGEGGWQCSYPDSYEETEYSCDGLDNDCDGETDEGLGLGETCQVGIGACTAIGVLVCAANGQTKCSAIAGEPSPEICDGVDNDCDGETDEGFVDETKRVGDICTVGIGACMTVGKYRCSADGSALVCSAVPGQPTQEICGDGIDNDCDGETDESECGGGGCMAMNQTSVSIPLLLLWTVLFIRVACARASKARQRPMQ